MGIEMHTVPAFDPQNIEAMDRHLDIIEEEITILRARIRAAHQTRVTAIPMGQPQDRPAGMFFAIQESPRATSFSTWFHLPGQPTRIVVGADHSLEAWGQDRAHWPGWARKYSDAEIIRRPGGMDIVFFGIPDTTRLPPDLEPGMRVSLFGFPAGVTDPDHYERRDGTVYMHREEDGSESVIIAFDTGETTAIGGMSGGPVFLLRPDGSLGELVAELITRNSRADLDGDGRAEHSSDVVELNAALRAVRRARQIAAAPLPDALKPQVA